MPITLHAWKKAKSYFAEIVQLLSIEKNWIVSFVKLNERYESLEGCDTDLLLQEATRTRFIQPIVYNPQAKYYLVRFWSSDVKVEFAYDVRKGKSAARSWMGGKVVERILLRPGAERRML